MNIQQDYEELFELLNYEKVKYLIVGAYALALHGYPRYTGDIDIFVKQNVVNVRRLLRVLKKFGFGTVGITEKGLLEKRTVVQLGYPPNRIDLITSIEGVTFDSAWKNRISGSFGTQIVSYISKEDLIKNKLAAKRDKDLLDVKMLQSKKTSKKK